MLDIRDQISGSIAVEEAWRASDKTAGCCLWHIEIRTSLCCPSQVGFSEGCVGTIQRDKVVTESVSGWTAQKGCDRVVQETYGRALEKDIEQRAKVAATNR